MTTTSPARRPAARRGVAPADGSAALATLRTAAVFDALGSSPAGLSTGEAAARRARGGPNRLETTPPTPLWRSFLGNVTHLMAVLLWIGGAIALVAELPQLAIAVWIVNLVNGTFSTWQEHRAERAVQALRRLLPLTATVLRDGVAVTCDAEDLVTGDVVLLAEGDRVSADARLVEAHELRVDQSSLTGESRAVRRTAAALPEGTASAADRLNLVYAGTSVIAGRGKGVVCATGMATEFGEVAALTQRTRREPSPLQQELATLSRVVGVIAIAVGVGFFLLAQALTDLPLARGLVFALGMIVAFVPEGLLPTVTLSLALGTQRMAARNALVRRLSAVETLGCATVICTDKTGTLTANQMTVRAIVLDGARYEVTGTGYDPAGALLQLGQPLTDLPADIGSLARTGVLTNDARLLPPEEGGSWQALGDPTEAALLALAVKCGVDPDRERARAPRIAEVPFDAERRRMSTLHEEGGRRILRCKGAPTELLDRCAWHLTAAGVRPLDDRTRRRVLASNDELARETMRVLAVAERDVTDAEGEIGELEHQLTFVGLVGMLDPPRPAVEEAVRTCRRAGIRLIMVTGDHGVTAESVARRIGLVGRTEPLRIVDGREVDDLDDGALQSLVRTPVVFARSAPAHKLRIVQALQAQGEVVAVTGDGVNDAPALKQADIGVAMGASGTDVAREAADLVLLDDDLASIVAAIEEGRAVYDNVRKFTGYIFTSNTPEAVPFMVFALSGGTIPIALDVMHILAIDLGTDLVPALGLGAERPEPGLMDRPPRSRDAHLVTPGLLRRSYLLLGPVQAAVVMAAFLLAYRAMGVEGPLSSLPDTGPIYAAATAAALAAVVTTQIGNLLAHRSERSSSVRGARPPNRLLLFGVLTELVIIGAIVYLPPLQAIVGTAPFPAWLWAPLLAVAPTLLVVDEVRKAVLRRRTAGRR